MNYLNIAKNYFPVTDKTKVIVAHRPTIQIPVLRAPKEATEPRKIEFDKFGFWWGLARFVGKLVGKPQWGKGRQYYIPTLMSIIIETNQPTNSDQPPMGYNEEYDILAVYEPRNLDC